VKRLDKKAKRRALKMRKNSPVRIFNARLFYSNDQMFHIWLPSFCRLRG